LKKKKKGSAVSYRTIFLQKILHIKQKIQTYIVIALGAGSLHETVSKVSKSWQW